MVASFHRTHSAVILIVIAFMFAALLETTMRHHLRDPSTNQRIFQHQGAGVMNMEAMMLQKSRNREQIFVHVSRRPKGSPFIHLFQNSNHDYI